MKPSWRDFPDYLASEFPHLRDAIEAEALEWSPHPHYFIEMYLFRELMDSARTANRAAASHAGNVLEELLGSSDPDLAEAALHAAVTHLAQSETYELVRSYLGDRAAQLATKIRAGTG